LNLAIGKETIRKIKQMFGSRKEMEVHNEDYDQEQKEEEHDLHHWDWTNINKEEQVMLKFGLHHPFYEE